MSKPYAVRTLRGILTLFVEPIRQRVIFPCKKGGEEHLSAIPNNLVYYEPAISDCLSPKLFEVRVGSGVGI